MTTFDWALPLESPDGNCFWWAESTVAAFDEDFEVTVYYEMASREEPPKQDQRFDKLGAFVEAAHAHLRSTLRATPETLGLNRADADIALERREPGAFADAAEIILYLDGDTLIRFPYADLPGTEEFGLGITIHIDGTLELQDLRDSIEVGGGSA